MMCRTRARGKHKCTEKMLESRAWEFWFEMQIRRKGVVGAFIRTCREHHRLTQVKLARALAITQSSLSKLESGSLLPSKQLRLQLAELFHCSDSLFMDM